LYAGGRGVLVIPQRTREKDWGIAENEKKKKHLNKMIWNELILFIIILILTFNL